MPSAPPVDPVSVHSELLGGELDERNHLVEVVLSRIIILALLIGFWWLVLIRIEQLQVSRSVC